MPIGIRPTNDFAFKKTFGSESNKLSLVSLLNAILELPSPISEVTIQNPYNLQDFYDDKLSILDIKAVDQQGTLYDIEVQLSVFKNLVPRLVFYGCEMYAGQLKAGEDYAKLHPAFSICLIDGILWPEATQVHHAFRLTDQKSGRTLAGTLEIHTLELGRYNLKEAELASATMLERWLFWLLHAHEYDSEVLLNLLPNNAIRQATQTITHIAELTEDKVMYDSREKARRDRLWEKNALVQEGRQEGRKEEKIKNLHIFQQILNLPLTSEEELQRMGWDELVTLWENLQEAVLNR